MSQQAAVARRRELRRIVGEDGLAELTNHTQALRALAADMTLMHGQLATLDAAAKHAHAFTARPFLERLRWLFMGH
jgi:hypothetical protein